MVWRQIRVNMLRSDHTPVAVRWEWLGVRGEVPKTGGKPGRKWPSAVRWMP